RGVENGHNPWEVLWVHVQLVGMDVTQVMESGLEAIQVVGCIVKSCQNPLAMGLYFGAEIPLGPWVDEEQPNERGPEYYKIQPIIDMLPCRGNGGLLFG
uniref:Uncharacterized protein n=1 Tax=Leptobrachium leishanense TaxID=445787 RepID=A0A8C5N551_9ANUR